ncbi:DUF1330 domain-containing protein [Nitratireductor kimnyeongensis]|uniref:DUF1330 domain-containing protein n=1 Tax=Nitratireductor kimnyeongensis TaxID=430679 RepID=A0ABW0TC98_9HYPH|nr:DUF1330 domain-containing protein [Nitratireductor kimnyeongensis]QZZ35483.1 DUF1330 domain-containing protein [Nitratireductor kimnyeongensis]
MSYYSVLDVTPTADDWIPGYLPTANARVATHGGRYLARTASHEQVEGDEQPAALRIIIEWPSKANAEAFMADEAYAPHLAARTDGSVSHHYLIEGKDDLA